MEFAEPLKRYLQPKHCHPLLDVPVFERLNILHDVALGLKFLHSLDIAHGDICLNNILLKDGVAKIADFGLSSLGHEWVQSKKQAFQPDFGAPEQLWSESYSPRPIDIW